MIKTIGLLGGMSWESTQIYYQIINQRINEVLGQQHSAKIILYSVDFDQIERLQRQNKWSELGFFLADAAKQLETIGADFLVLCTNTMHKIASQIENRLSIPFLHIGDVIAEAILLKKIKKIGLLGTKYTMTENFYKARLAVYGIEVMVPSKKEQNFVHNVIFNELCKGKIEIKSKREFLSIIDQLVSLGAEGIVLGCTEIGMLVSDYDTSTILFDTAVIHAQKAADYALA